MTHFSDKSFQLKAKSTCSSRLPSILLALFSLAQALILLYPPPLPGSIDSFTWPTWKWVSLFLTTKSRRGLYDKSHDNFMWTQQYLSYIFRALVRICMDSSFLPAMIAIVGGWWSCKSMFPWLVLNHFFASTLYSLCIFYHNAFVSRVYIYSYKAVELWFLIMYGRENSVNWIPRSDLIFWTIVQRIWVNTLDRSQVVVVLTRLKL